MSRRRVLLPTLLLVGTIGALSMTWSSTAVADPAPSSPTTTTTEIPGLPPPQKVTGPDTPAPGSLESQLPPPQKVTGPDTTEPGSLESQLPPLRPESSDSPGIFDISGRVEKAIDDWLAGLVESAINPALELLGKTLLSAPDVTEQGQVREIWMISVSVANAAFVLLAVVGGVIVMTHDTVQTRYSVKEILPRLVFAVIATNASLFVCSQCISIANALARSFLGSGIDSGSAIGGLGGAIIASAATGGFVVLLAVGVTAIVLLLACTFLARVVMVVLLTVAAPVALACHALPQTEGLATLWWRSIAACLAIQVGQAIVLVAALRIFFTSPEGVFGISVGDGLVSLLVLICLFWIMLRIPTWAGRAVFGGSGGPVQTAKERVVYVVKTAALAAL